MNEIMYIYYIIFTLNLLDDNGDKTVLITKWEILLLLLISNKEIIDDLIPQITFDFPKEDIQDPFAEEIVSIYILYIYYKCNIYIIYIIYHYYITYINI